jgi:hypothetical protein
LRLGLALVKQHNIRRVHLHTAFHIHAATEIEFEKISDIFISSAHPHHVRGMLGNLVILLNLLVQSLVGVVLGALAVDEIELFRDCQLVCSKSARCEYFNIEKGGIVG